MERYQVADSSNGPWLELIETDNPSAELALSKARASFPGWNPVWVAKMRDIEGKDILPSREIFWADIKERLAIEYGNQLVDEMEIVFNTMPFEALEHAISMSIGYCGVDIQVPEIKKPYYGGQIVRRDDFTSNPEEKVKVPSLKELLDE